MNQSKLERELHMLDDMIETVRKVRGHFKKKTKFTGNIYNTVCIGNMLTHVLFFFLFTDIVLYT